MDSALYSTVLARAYCTCTATEGTIVEPAWEAPALTRGPSSTAIPRVRECVGFCDYNATFTRQVRVSVDGRAADARGQDADGHLDVLVWLLPRRLPAQLRSEDAARVSLLVGARVPPQRVARAHVLACSPQVHRGHVGDVSERGAARAYGEVWLFVGRFAAPRHGHARRAAVRARQGACVHAQ